MRWLYATLRDSSSDGAIDGALADIAPLVLAFLDFASLQQLSSVSREASISAVRIAMLQRATVQLTVSSRDVHNVLMHMKMRSFLHTVEIRNCWATPRECPTFRPALLAGFKSVIFSSDKTLNQHVHQQATYLAQETQQARGMSHDGFVRRVRRRMNQEASSMTLGMLDSRSPYVEESLYPWFGMLPPVLTAFNLGDLRIDDLHWLTRFSQLKSLAFNASTTLRTLSLEPVVHLSATLQELVITQLTFTSCDELAALTSLRKLELREAMKLPNIEFVRNMTKLERLVLTEMVISDLSPLLALGSLKDLTLDSIAPRAPVSMSVHEDTQAPTSLSLGIHDAAQEPALFHLESLQLLFTWPPMPQLLHHCPNLIQLHLCQVAFRDWTPLRNLQQLERVAINVDDVEDWSPLAELPHLKRLALDSKKNQIYVCRSFCTGWKSLEELVTQPWQDYTPLVAHAPALKCLQLLGWRDNDSIATLRDARQLETLRIAFVPGAVDLSSLSELRQLKNLHLWSASAVSITFLRQLTNLVELIMPCPYGSAAGITDFKPLENLVKLKTLVLTGRREFKSNHLDIVTKLPELKNLNVDGTSVASSKMMKLKSRYDMQWKGKYDLVSPTGVPM